MIAQLEVEPKNRNRTGTLEPAFGLYKAEGTSLSSFGFLCPKIPSQNQPDHKFFRQTLLEGDGGTGSWTSKPVIFGWVNLSKTMMKWVLNHPRPPWPPNIAGERTTGAHNPNQPRPIDPGLTWKTSQNAPAASGKAWNIRIKMSGRHCPRQFSKNLRNSGDIATTGRHSDL